MDPFLHTEYEPWIHFCIVETGVTPDVYVGSTLVNVYGNCESLVDANIVTTLLFYRIHLSSPQAMFYGPWRCPLGHAVLHPPILMDIFVSMQEVELAQPCLEEPGHRVTGALDIKTIRTCFCEDRDI